MEYVIHGAADVLCDIVVVLNNIVDFFELDALVRPK